MQFLIICNLGVQFSIQSQRWCSTYSGSTTRKWGTTDRPQSSWSDSPKDTGCSSSTSHQFLLIPRYSTTSFSFKTSVPCTRSWNDNYTNHSSSGRNVIAKFLNPNFCLTLNTFDWRQTALLLNSELQNRLRKQIFVGSGSGSVGGAAPSNTRGPRFESSHRGILLVRRNERKKPIFLKKNKSLISLQHRNRLEQADRVPLSSRRLRQVKRRRLERRRFRRHPPRPRREDGGR